MDIEVAVSAAVSKQDLSQDAGTQRVTKARSPRTGRLLRHADFERVYKLGKRHFSASMTFFYLQRSDVTRQGSQTEDSQTKGRRTSQRPPGDSALRVGFTVGRALGGAVQRNRMKRRLREAVRLSCPAGSVTADIVINPKKVLLRADFANVVSEVKKAFVVIEQKLAGKNRQEVTAEQNFASRSLKPEA
jgi:ribonuclease P protein component